MAAPAHRSDRRAARVGLIVLIAALCMVGLGVARRALVMSWFFAGAAAPVELREALPARASRVRIILVDGLGLAEAREHAALDRVCARGREVVVDVGFPTVSLPVQHVLWTGLTQEQSGVLFSNRRLDPAPAFAFPSRVPSIAIAQSHGEIARSFGFGEVLAPADGEDDVAWERSGFEASVPQMLGSNAVLGFVHIMAVDAAGHAAGRDSIEYGDAAAHASAWVERWIPTTVADDEVWLWLADHGHGEVGGHGGAEPAIRRVRACILAGATLDHALPDEVRLVDVAASLSGWLGTALPVASRGVPMHALRSSTHSELPRPSNAAVLLALAVVGAGLLIGKRVGGRTSLLPWWFLLGYASFVVLHGVPTLSLPPVFPRYGDAALLATAPGGLLAAVFARRAVGRGGSPFAVAVALLAAPLATWVGVIVAGGTVTAMGGATLVPYVSAHGSVLASLLQCGVLGTALGTAVAIVFPAPQTAITPDG